MKIVVSLWALLFAFLLIFSCTHPFIATSQEASSGNLNIIIEDADARLISPDADMQATEFRIEGSGPGEATILEWCTGITQINDLAAGEWIFSVTAFNADGIAIGRGSSTIIIVNNSTVSSEITILPFDGFGTLDLSLEWIEGEINSPRIECSLIPVLGSERSLDFFISGNQATFFASDIPTGYYTLVIRLFDDNILTKSVVEVVWIVKNMTSTGSFLFDLIDLAQGGFDLNIESDIASPLDLQIIDIEEKKPENLSIRLHASISNYSDNVTYVWYVNGEAKGIGETFIMDDSWPQGRYWVDVTACSADGLRGGSTGFILEVGASVGSFRSIWRDENSALHIPLSSNGFYDFYIDWGDGTIEHITSVTHGYISHDYGDIRWQEYEITISGTCEGFGFNRNDTFLGQLLEIIEWGGVKFHDEGFQLYGCEDLENPNGIFSRDFINLSYLTNMRGMFFGCDLFNADLSSWDTSSVTNMSYMFYGCRNFNSDLSSWDTSSVTNMSYLFYNCINFNSDLSSWDTSSVANMSYMFSGCGNFNSDLSSWNTSSVSNMSEMFKSCVSFNSDLTSWNTSLVTDLSGMFQGCTVFNGDLSSWNTSSVIIMLKMFYGASMFNQDLSSWDTSSVESMERMFNYATAFNCGNIDINTWQWNVGNIQAPYGMNNMFTYSSIEGSEPPWYNEF